MDHIVPITPQDTPLYAVPVPTLAALFVGRADEAVLVLEAAVWAPAVLPVHRVAAWWGGALPMDTEGGRIACEAGWAFIYGLTEDTCRAMATEHAERVAVTLAEDVATKDTMAMAMDTLAGQLAIRDTDMDMGTEAYVSALATHPYFA